MPAMHLGGDGYTRLRQWVAMVIGGALLQIGVDWNRWPLGLSGFQATARAEAAR